MDHNRFSIFKQFRNSMSPSPSLVERLASFQPYEFSYGTDLPSGVVRPCHEIDSFVGWYAKHPELSDVKVINLDIRAADGKLFGFAGGFHQLRGCQGFQGAPGPETDQQRADRLRLEQLERDEARRQLLAKPPLPSCHLMLTFEVECQTAVFERQRSELEKTLKNRSLPAQPAFEAMELTETKYVPIGYRIRPHLRAEIHAAHAEAQLDNPDLTFCEFLLDGHGSNELYGSKWVEKIVDPTGSNVKCFYRCQEATSVKSGRTRVRFTLMTSSLVDERNLEALRLFLRETTITRDTQ